MLIKWGKSKIRVVKMSKKLMTIMWANLINLMVGLINSFVLPKFLPIETYAMIKTYLLYAGYAGFFHFGYCDGMFLKYGGKRLETISADINENFSGLCVVSFTSATLVFCVSAAIGNLMLTFFAIGILAANIIDYYKLLFQAVGEFKLYGQALNWQKILLLLVDLCLIFVFGTQAANSYIVIRILIPVFVVLALSYTLHSRIPSFKVVKVSIKTIGTNITSGFVLMLGNFSTVLFTGLDRWFVSLLMSSTNFAMYAFAVSVENFLNMFVTPISVSLYNELCINRQHLYVLKIKKMTLLWAILIIAGAYPIKWILNNWLIEYQEANSVIFLLFAMQLFQIIIKSVYVNLYKANKQQNRYFVQMLSMLILAIFLNAILYYCFGTIGAIAIATLITNIVWFILCEVTGDKQIRFCVKEYSVIAVVLMTYLLTGLFMTPINGCVIYLCVSLMMTLIFMWPVIWDMFSAAKNILGLSKKK